MTVSTVTQVLTGERWLARTPAVAIARHTTRSLDWPTSPTKGGGGMMATTSTTGCRPNGYSRTTIGAEVYLGSPPKGHRS